MDDASQNDDLLIRYIDGGLTAEEKDSLERRLQTDAALRDQLTDLQISVQAVKHYGLSQEIGAIHTGMMRELKGPKPKAKLISFRRRFRVMIAAAAVVLLVLIGVSLYLSSQVSANKLYAQAFVDFPVSTTRGAGGLSVLEAYYQDKNYDAIISASRSVQMNNKDSLLTGLSYLHTNRMQQAIGFFQRIASYQNNLQQDGEFYLALSFLKTKQSKKAVSLFEKISANPSHLYHSRITNEFLDDVKSLDDE